MEGAVGHGDEGGVAGDLRGRRWWIFNTKIKKRGR